MNPNKPDPERPRRRLLTVEQLAEEFATPKSTLYDFLRRNPQAGVMRIGKAIRVDADEFEAFVRTATWP